MKTESKRAHAPAKQESEAIRAVAVDLGPEELAVLERVAGNGIDERELDERISMGPGPGC